MTLAGFARTAGVSRDALFRWTRGDVPRGDKRSAIAKTLGVSRDEVDAQLGATHAAA